MDEILTTFSGEFIIGGYNELKISETVELPPEIVSEVDVGLVVATIADMGEENPCMKCHTMLYMVRELASRYEREPEDMESINMECAPDKKDPGFYTALGTLPDGKSHLLKGMRCELLLWMEQNLSKNTNGG